MGVQAASAIGRLEGLRALRDALAAEIDAGPGEKGSQTATLARQLRDVLREVDELERARPRGSIVDELREHKKRKARGAGSKGVVPAAGGGQESG